MTVLNAVMNLLHRINSLEDNSGSPSVEIDFATPEEVLTAMTTANIVEEPTQ